MASNSAVFADWECIFILNSLSVSSRVVSMLDSGAQGPGFKSQPRCCRVSLRQTVHTHPASVHQATKLVAALLRVARVTVSLAESNGSLPPGLWLTSPAGWLPRTGISSGTLRSAIEYGLPLPFLLSNVPLGMTETGSVFRSESVGRPNATTSTEPRLVPIHRHGHATPSVPRQQRPVT